MSPALAGGFLTTAPLGKSAISLLICYFRYFYLGGGDGEENISDLELETVCFIKLTKF